MLVDLTRVAEEREDGYLAEPRSPYSQSGVLRAAEVAAMRPDEVASLRLLSGRIAGDDTAAAAARDLMEAGRLAFLHGGTAAAVQAALLRSFFVVERIARKVGYDRDLAATAAKEQQDRVERLRNDLSRASAAQRVKQVRNAARDLDVIEARFLPDQIRNAAVRLDLPERVRDDALELATLRNKRLGHAGRADEGAGDLGPRVESAAAVAVAFLAAYADTLGDT